MVRRITTIEYQHQIKDTPYLLLGEYRGHETKVTHLCMKCSNVWDVTPHQIKRGYSCPECSNRKQSKDKTLTNSEYQESIQHTSYLLLGDYKGARTKAPHLCMNCSYV